MIKVTIATAEKRTSALVAESMTPKAVLSENGVANDRATVIIDGAPATPAMMNKSLKELGITDSCTIATVVKMDNASI